jgi:phosphocarrier protein
MTVATAIIRNEQGIHCRPSAKIIMEAKGFEGSVKVSSEYDECDLSSAMDLLMLALAKGSEVKIEVDGSGEREFCQKLVELFEYNFDFPQD